MLQSVQREIAIMKKLHHKNCVSMYEVIDCPDSVSAHMAISVLAFFIARLECYGSQPHASQAKLYIRLEYVEGGQCMPSENNVTPLDFPVAKV